MKQYLLLSLLLCAGLSAAWAQVYEIDAFNGQTVNNCSGKFYDSGGQFGFYQNNENFTVTFCPSNPNTSIRIDFVQFNLGTGDQLCVYDGTNTSAPAFGCFSNVTPATAAQASSTNSTGCLTFTFTSDGNNSGSGWDANISCVLPCQTVLSELRSSNPAAVPTVNGYIDVCSGQTVQLFGGGQYPQNNANYFQQDATSTFEWVIEGQTFPGQNINHRFNTPGGYVIQLNVTDSLGCPNTNQLSQKVRVAGPPSFDGTFPDVTSICIGDTVILTGEAESPIQTFAPPLSRGDSIFLPDGVGVCYATTLNFSSFNQGQTITSINDIIDICVVMEHSYMGDLNIQIECPNGQTATLHQYSGGGGTYLGEPIDIDTDLSPGLGYPYCWTPTATQTWTQAVNNGNTINVNGNTTLAPGSYASSQPLSALIGCPLNGTWEIEICDNLSIDNGYVFSWGIQFDPAIYPSLDSFQLGFSSQSWNAAPNTIIANQGDTIVTVVPPAPGNATYNFTVINEFGCSYDTSVTVNVLQFTDPACFSCDTLNLPAIADTTICLGDNVQFDATTTTNFNDLTFTNMPSVTVPTNSFIDIPITVSGVPSATIGAGVLQSVCIDITHVLPDDLDIFLVSPSGAVLELSTDNNGGGLNYTSTCFSPTATTPITAGVAPFTGTWLPEGNFNILNGSSTNGTWFLRIGDDSPGFDGVVNSISLTFQNIYNVTYGWTPTTGLSCTNCPNPVATPTSTTTYVVTATDNYGCTETDTVTVTVAPPPATPAPTCGTITASTITVNWPAAANANAYEVNINGTGWIPSNGTLSHTITGLATGQTVQIEVRSLATNCSTPSPAALINCSTPTCDLSILLDSTQAVTCFGYSDGAVFFTASSSFGGINYTLGGTTYSASPITGLSAGNYSLYISDALGCQDSIAFTVTQPATVSLNLDSSLVSCFAANDGAVSVVAAGGQAPYTYLWSNAQTDSALVNLGAGQYTVTVTDANGCQYTDSASISEPPALSLLLDSTNVNCFGGNDGRAWLTLTGGTPTYGILWSNGATTDTLSSLSTGTYTVTATDANGCNITDSLTITQPSAPLSSTITVTNNSCFQSSDGSLSANVAGGTTPYAYAWSSAPDDTLATASNLAAGAYTVTITDANGCTITDSATVQQPTPIGLSFSSTPLSCPNADDGSATVTPTGGNGGYAFQWLTLPLQVGATASNLPEGWTTVIVTDANGCTATDSVNITAPNLTLAVSGTDLSCFGANDGQAIAQVAGGAGSYTYLWSNNAVNPTTSNLAAGTYTVTITDANGCSLTDSVTLSEPSAINLTLTPQAVNCFGGSDGSISTITTGGTGGYTYTWSTVPPQTTPNITGLTAGTYTVTVTDATGCSQVDSIAVIQPSIPFQATISATMPSCFGGSDGTATANATGGTPGPTGYSYLWSNAQTTRTATGLPAGSYSVTITDAGGCFVVENISVQQPTPMISIIAQQPASCFGNSDGLAQVTVSGGTPDANGLYLYRWNTAPPQLTRTAISLRGGQTYTVTVTDDNGCTLVDSIVVQQPAPVTTAPTYTMPSCNGGCDGFIDLTTSGGTGPYAYSWSTGQDSATALDLCAGTYFVTVTDANGCTTSQALSLSQPTAVATQVTTTDNVCFGDSAGTIRVLVAGGTPFYSFAWSNGAPDLPTQEGLGAGTYTLTVTDANGCETTENIAITAPSSAIAASFNLMDASCYGERDGSAIINAIGGTPPYVYSLDGQTYLGTNVFPGLFSGEYPMYIRDNLGCIYRDTFVITQPDELIVELPADTVITEGDRIALRPFIQNGTLPYFYNWYPTEDSTLNCYACPVPVVEGLQSNQTYTLMVTDANGCQGMDDIMIQVNKVRRVYVATGFTPNGDNTNDYLYPQGGFGTLRVLQFEVFDRWGESVFYTEDIPLNDPSLGWDGTFKGRPLNPGVFAWQLVVEFSDGERIYYSGNTTLIR